MSNFGASRTGTDDWGRVHSFPVAGEYREDILQSDDGMVWRVAGQTHDTLTVWHEMEPAGESIHDYIVDQFKPGGVFLDIGAHEGHYAIRAAKAGMRAIAVEANPDNIGHFISNMTLNAIDPGLVQVLCLAAWDDTVPLEFSLVPNAKPRNGSGTLMTPAGYETAGMTVMGVALDDLTLPWDALDLVKIDVEGAECHVLRGMRKLLEQHRPLVVLEDHTWLGVFGEDELDAALDIPGYRWQTAWDLQVRTRDRYLIGTPE
jgi:FkbM family methyltransferase